MADTTHTFPNPRLRLEATADEGRIVVALPSGREKALATTEADPVTGVTSIHGVPVAPNAVLLEGGTGASSGWVQSAAGPERFGLDLLTVTGGAPAVVTLEGSDDKVSSTLLMTANLDTVDSTLVTAALKSIYPLIRWTVQSAGTGSVRISRGV